MYKTSLFICISHMNKDMRLSISIIRHLHHNDDYVIRSVIIPQVPVPQLNEYNTKVINFH
jgi:hypothetical protein